MRLRWSTSSSSVRFSPRTEVTTLGPRLFLTTDGGYRRGTAAWAWVAQWYGQTRIVAQQTGIERDSTSARAELLAVVHALRWGTDQGPYPAPITVVSDSAYIVECFNDKWYERWLANGWTSSSGKPVANQDLWRELLQLTIFQDAMPVTFCHVRGHRGHPANELCDDLCGFALDEAEVQST